VVFFVPHQVILKTRTSQSDFNKFRPFGGQKSRRIASEIPVGTKTIGTQKTTLFPDYKLMENHGGRRSNTVRYAVPTVPER
jgi:hypothetical protein